MPTELAEFLQPPGVSGLRAAFGSTLIKGLVLYSPVCWGPWRIALYTDNRYANTSAGRGTVMRVLSDVICLGRLLLGWSCQMWVTGNSSIHVTRPTLTYSSNLWGPFSQALTLLKRAMLIYWCLRHPYLGEFQRGPRHF